MKTVAAALLLALCASSIAEGSRSPLARALEDEAPPLRLAQACNCPRTTPQCVVNPLRHETLCAPEDAVACVSEKKTWYCPRGKYCSDDNGGCQ